MKKSILLFTTVLCSLLVYAQTQIPNNSFEEWNVDTLKNLNGYMTTLSEGRGINSQSVVASTDSYSGNYSLRLETLVQNQDTIFGFAINFDPENFVGGTPFTFHADTIHGYYKSGIKGADTGLIIFALSEGGMPVVQMQIPFTASQNTNSWTKFSIPTQLPSTANPDSIMFGMVSSNAINEINITPGSWLMFDNITFSNTSGVTDTLNNYDFERWDETQLISLMDYTTSAIWAPLVSNPPSVERITDATDGLYALRINTILSDFGDTLQGFITNSDLDQAWDQLPSGSPFNWEPKFVTYDYQYSPVGSDSASIIFQFKNNTNPVGGHGINYSQATSGYVADTLYDFNFYQTPDSLTFLAYCGMNVGSSLTLDNIVFFFPLAVNETFELWQTKSFPNPAMDQLSFELFSKIEAPATLFIYSMSGQLMLQQQELATQGLNRWNLDINMLSKGNYIYKIQLNTKSITKQFIKL